MADLPASEQMDGIVRGTIELAAVKLGPEEVAKLAEVMSAFCLDLTDLDRRYYVAFSPDGSARFAEDAADREPMLTITTTTPVLHAMACGETEPAKAFAMRKVKLAGVPLMKLARVAGDLIDVLFECYREKLPS